MSSTKAQCCAIVLNDDQMEQACPRRGSRLLRNQEGHWAVFCSGHARLALTGMVSRSMRVVPTKARRLAHFHRMVPWFDGVWEELSDDEQTSGG